MCGGAGVRFGGRARGASLHPLGRGFKIQRKWSGGAMVGVQGAGGPGDGSCRRGPHPTGRVLCAREGEGRGRCTHVRVGFQVLCVMGEGGGGGVRVGEKGGQLSE